MSHHEPSYAPCDHCRRVHHSTEYAHGCRYASQWATASFFTRDQDLESASLTIAYASRMLGPLADMSETDLRDFIAGVHNFGEGYFRQLGVPVVD